MKDTLPIKVEIMAKDIEFLKGEVSEIKQAQKNAAEKHDLAEIKTMLIEHTKEEREMWDRLLAMKANVWVENAARYALYTVAGILIVAVLGLVLVKTNATSLLR